MFKSFYVLSVKFSFFFILFSSMALGQTMYLRTETQTTLRTRANGVLVKVGVLSKGTLIRARKKIGPQKYNHSLFGNLRSVKGWFRYLIIPVEQESAEIESDYSLKALNRMPLFISESSVEVISKAKFNDLLDLGSDTISDDPDQGEAVGEMSCFDLLTKEHKVSARALRKALSAYDKFEDRLNEKDLIAFTDYGISRHKKRFWMIDLKNCKVLSHQKTTNATNGFYCGRGNETNKIRSGAVLVRGYHWRGEKQNSGASRFKTWPNITFKKGKNNKMAVSFKPLSKTTRRVFSRGVVGHEANSFRPKRTNAKSNGCTILPTKISSKVIERKKGKKRFKRIKDSSVPGWAFIHDRMVEGTLLYNYIPQCH